MSTIKINNVNIYYELQGCENSPCLVFNNGILMNAASAWKPQVDILSQSYRILRYDFRGQGDSEHPEGEYTMELHADDLAELMSALNINKAHIAGLSYGGAVAQTFALRYPQRCSSLIIAGATSEIGDRLRLIINGWSNHAKNNDLENFFNSTVPWFFTPKTFRENPQTIENAKKRYARLDFEAVTRLCKCFLSINCTGQLKEIKIPTCIIVGDQDLLTERSYVEILHQNIPVNELHIIPSSGHIVWVRPSYDTVK